MFDVAVALLYYETEFHVKGALFRPTKQWILQPSIPPARMGACIEQLSAFTNALLEEREPPVSGNEGLLGVP